MPDPNWELNPGPVDCYSWMWIGSEGFARKTNPLFSCEHIYDNGHEIFVICMLNELLWI